MELIDAERVTTATIKRTTGCQLKPSMGTKQNFRAIKDAENTAVIMQH